jgi:hypothetical protein
MNVTARDIARGVIQALLISALTFLGVAFVDGFFGRRLDVTVQRTALLDKQGYLLQFENSRSSAIEGVTVSIARNVKIEASSVDNGVTVRLSSAPHHTELQLSNLPPNRRVNLFLAIVDFLPTTEFTVLQKGESYSIVDRNTQRYAWFNYSNLVDAILLVLIYTAATLWFNSRMNVVREQTRGLEAAHESTKAALDKTATESRERMKDLESKIDKARAAQLRIQMILQRRIIELISENDIWRDFFKTIYRSVFKSTAEAETALDQILHKLGIKHRGAHKLSELSEVDFLELIAGAKVERPA